MTIFPAVATRTSATTAPVRAPAGTSAARSTFTPAGTVTRNRRPSRRSARSDTLRGTRRSRSRVAPARAAGAGATAGGSVAVAGSEGAAGGVALGAGVAVGVGVALGDGGDGSADAPHGRPASGCSDV